MRNPMWRSLDRTVVLPSTPTSELASSPTALVEAVSAALGDTAGQAVAAIVAAQSSGRISRSVAARLVERLVPSRDSSPLLELPASLDTAADWRQALKTLYSMRRSGLISDAEWVT